jgi:hypothetical protein
VSIIAPVVEDGSIGGVDGVSLGSVTETNVTADEDEGPLPYGGNLQQAMKAQVRNGYTGRKEKCRCATDIIGRNKWGAGRGKKVHVLTLSISLSREKGGSGHEQAM